jgi:hypothetical protein
MGLLWFTTAGEPVTKDLIQALWSLSEDSKWAYKQALEGRDPDMHTLGMDWKRVEDAIQRENLNRRMNGEE